MQTRSKKPRTRSKKSKTVRSDDFVSVARRLGADEDKATFEAKLAKIVTGKPKAKGRIKNC
jgi:hypothetical protein